MKNAILLLTLFVLCAACKTFDITSMRYGDHFSDKLPPLKPEFDSQSFGPQYPNIYDSAAMVLSGTLDPEHLLRNASIEQKISYDTKAIYTHEIMKNLSKKVGQTQGTAVCRRGFRSRGITTALNPVLSIITLGIVNLFGYPAAVHKDELELIVDIYDLNNNVVASFSGMGYGEAKEALYKGYNKSNARRKAHALAFKEALENIKIQIKESRIELSNALAMK